MKLQGLRALGLPAALSACAIAVAACGAGGGGETPAGGAASAGGAMGNTDSGGGASGGGRSDAGPGGTGGSSLPGGAGGTGGHATTDQGVSGGTGGTGGAGGGVGGTAGGAMDAASGGASGHGGSPADAGPGSDGPSGGADGGAEPPERDAGPEGPDFGGGPVINDVRINEIDCHGDDWVELINLSDEEIDLSGWVLTDTLEDVAPEGHAYILPIDTVIEPNGFLVLLQTDMGDAIVGFDFGIACGEEHIRLVRPNGTTADHVEVPERDSFNTWGRFRDGEGDFIHTMPTKGLPNQPGIDPIPLLFDPLVGGVPTIDLFIEPDNVQRLVSDPRSTVPGDFQIQLPDDLEPSAPVQIGVHLKGRIGSFRPITGKSGFKIDMNQYVDTQRLFGLKELTLNNMVQDRSAMSQFAAYEIFRAVGVCAPRVGYAWVRVNGEDYGLYAHLQNYDDLLFSTCFPDTNHVYEGRYGEDLRQDLVDRLDVKEGDPMERSDMHAIVDALDTPPGGDIYGSEEAQALFDWEKIVMSMAVEQYIGHWDGYSPTRNNWVMHVDGDSRLSLQPWGTDQCFGRNNNIYEGQGRLFQVCMANVACRNAYETAMGEIMNTMDGLNLEPLVRDVYAVIQPFVAEDPRSPYREAGVSNSVNDLLGFLTRRRMDLGIQFECILGANADPDGDGFRCETDCAPDDPTINPGAVDECRDGIDQNCNGAVDDDQSCPDCDTIERDGHRYLICTTPRNWQDAEAHCAFFGAHLAAPDHPLEAAWLYEKAHAITQQDFWIGLNDRDSEAFFSFWLNAGDNAGAFPWAPGQPDNAGEEDCVYIQAATGLYDDFNCLRQKAVICEDTCVFTGDRDRDGLNHCSADCDDSDNTIFPGAPEICGDGLDQSCDGVVDEGANCDCFQVFRGSHLYKFCGGARTAADARNACQAQGADLAVFDTPGEAAWVHAQALGLTDAPLWIGLQDRFAIDEWAWVNGDAPTYLAWSPGEPSAAGVEDCAVLRGDDGRWDDQACDLSFGSICEDACGGRRIDLDQDGYPACGNDCDDGAAGTHPGAAEICNDGVDQNCDGQVDEGCP